MFILHLYKEKEVFKRSHFAHSAFFFQHRLDNQFSCFLFKKLGLATFWQLQFKANQEFRFLSISVNTGRSRFARVSPKTEWHFMERNVSISVNTGRSRFARVSPKTEGHFMERNGILC